MKYFFNCVDLKGYVLDDHDQEGELDSEGLFFIDGAGDVRGGYISAHYF